jgi:hypothetical protein
MVPKQTNRLKMLQAVEIINKLSLITPSTNFKSSYEAAAVEVESVNY